MPFLLSGQQPLIDGRQTLSRFKSAPRDVPRGLFRILGTVSNDRTGIMQLFFGRRSRQGGPVERPDRRIHAAFLLDESADDIARLPEHVVNALPIDQQQCLRKRGRVGAFALARHQSLRLAERKQESVGGVKESHRGPRTLWTPGN